MKKFKKGLSIILSLMMMLTSANLVMASEETTEGTTSVVHNYTRIYAGDYDDCKNGDPNFPVKSVEYDSAEGKSAGNLNSGSWIKYEDVEVKETVNKLSLKYGAGSGATSMAVRIGSETADPIARFTTKNTSWQWGEDTAPFEKALVAGTYDIYLTFDGSGFDLNYFGFSCDAAYENITPVEHDYTKIYGGDYNDSFSGNKGALVKVATYQEVNSIDNFYSGSWAKYTAVEVKEKVNKLTQDTRHL